MTNYNYKVSIFTCVYNRAHTIHRVFDSIKKQTYKNIEHVIIDDGSDDDIEKLVNKYIKEVDHDVIFIRRENGGKHTATNIAWDNCHGDFIIQLDSDDELLPNAIEFLVSTYEKIPNKKEFWCVQGRCMDQINKKMIGDLYPENINLLKSDLAKKIAKRTSGGKIGLMKKSILDNYRYPNPKYVTFVTESYLWYLLNEKYKTWYTNEIVYIYYLNEGNNLSKSKKTRQVFSNETYALKYFLTNRKQFKLPLEIIINYYKRYLIFYELSTKAFQEEYSKYLDTNNVLMNIVIFLTKIPLKLLSVFYIHKWHL